MKKNGRVTKKVLSFFIASSLGCVQTLSMFPVSAMASETDTSQESSSDILYGDADNNGTTDNDDAVLIENYVRNSDNYQIADTVAADVDKDSKITLRDAEIILQWKAGTISDLPYTEEVNWKYYPAPSNYVIVNDGLTWQEAESKCEEHGAHLAVITSQREQAMIEALVNETKSPKNNYWIGMTRNDDKEFEWITGESLDYTNWQADNPNNLDGNQNAVLFYGDHSNGEFGRWDDIAYSGIYGGYAYYGLDDFGYIMEKGGEPISDFHLWNDPDSLPSAGYYKLDCDVTAESITVNEALDLDLNGHKINIESINCKGNVIIRDSDWNGSTYSSSKGSINCTSTETLFNVDGSLTIYNGVINCKEYSTEPAVKVSSTGKFENVNGYFYANRGSIVCLGSGNSYALFTGGRMYNTSDNGNGVLLSEGFTGIAHVNGSLINSDGIAIYGKNSKGILKVTFGITQSNKDFGVRIDGDTLYDFSNRVRFDGEKGSIYLNKGQTITLTDTTRFLGLAIYAEEPGVVIENFSKYFKASDKPCYVNGDVVTDANGDPYFRPTEKSPRYKLIETPLTWKKAKAYCESIGGHLVTITSATEQSQVQALMSDVSDCWIGGFRNADTAFGWVTEEPMTYTNWKGSEPKNNSEEDYIKICNKSTWSNGSDDESLPFICEWEDTEYVPEIADPKPITTTTTATTTSTTTTTTSVTSTTSTIKPFSPVTTEYDKQIEEQVNEEKNEKLNIKGELTAKPMTKEEISSAGISVDDPENYHYFKYSVEMTFHDESIIFTKYEAVPVSYTPSTSGTPVLPAAPKPKIVYPNTNKPVNPGEPVYIPQINATATYYEYEEQEMFIIIYGECKWLKEFYDVQLIVMNSDKETLEDCSATLNVPEGLTLCNSDQTQSIGDLVPNDVKNIHWYLRGDVAGDYTISALFKGMNDGDEFEYPFYSENDIHVYAGDALKMTIEVPSYSCLGYEYPIRITMTNVSDRPIYGLENKINNVEHGYYNYKHICQDGTHKVIKSKVMLSSSASGKQSIRAEELNPGESAVIDIKVGDAWKSPLQKDLENKKIFIDILSLGTSGMPIAQFLATFTSEVISGTTVVHVLDSIFVSTLEGSTTEIPYEIIINDNLYEIGEGREFDLPHAFLNSGIDALKAAMDKSKDNPKDNPKDKIDDFKDDDLKINTKQLKEQMDDFNKVKKDELSPADFNLKHHQDEYLNYALSNGGNNIKDDDMNFKINDVTIPLSGTITVGKDIYNMVKPSDNSVSVDVFVTDAKDNRVSVSSLDPRNILMRRVQASPEPAIEFEVTNGDYEFNNGVYTVKSEAVLRIKANEPGEKFIIHFVDDDGYETIYPLISVAEHECTGGNFYVVSAPESGNDGLAVQLCTECKKPLSTRHIPSSFYAMLSDGQMFQNVYQAAEYAKDNYDEVELSLFGDITLDKDLVIPDNVKLLITPFANITFKNSAHIVVDGEYIDFTDNNEYEVYENIVLNYWDGRTEIMPVKYGEEVTELPELSGQCEFKGWYTDPEFTGSFVPFTSGDKNHSKIYYANGNGSSSVSDNHIASDDELCSWVINDYENRTGKAHISAEITSKSGDSYEITLKDKAGNVVDVYKVDPVTGNSSNSADEQVELPQTGNNSMYNWMIVSGAFMLIICGCFAVKFSGFIRRKEDEEQTEI